MTLADDSVLTDAQAWVLLATIDDPCSIACGRPVDIVSLGIVDAVSGGASPRVRLRLTEPGCLYRVWFMRRIRAVLGNATHVEFAAADELWDPPEHLAR